MNLLGPLRLLPLVFLKVVQSILEAKVRRSFKVLVKGNRLNVLQFFELTEFPEGRDSFLKGLHEALGNSQGRHGDTAQAVFLAHFLHKWGLDCHESASVEVIMYALWLNGVVTVLSSTDLSWVPSEALSLHCNSTCRSFLHE